MPQIIPVAGPTPAQPYSPSSGKGQSEARDRAIARLMGNQSPQPDAPKESAPEPQNASPVPNPSNVSVEELGAIKASDSGQPPSTEETTSDPSTATPATQEAKPATEKTEETPLSAQYAQLARKERALMAQIRQFKAEQAAFKAQQATPPPTASQPQDVISKADLLKDPWKHLKAMGVSYDQLTQQALNEPSGETQQLMGVIDELRNEIKSLKGEQENTKKTFQDSQAQAYEQAVTQIRHGVKDLVAKDTQYETVKAAEAQEDVVELILSTFKKDGRLMSVEEATREVEEYLVEEALKLSRLSKIQQRLSESAKPQTVPAKQTPASTAPKDPATQQQPQMKTLTNATAAARKLSARERAMLAFKGELKS